MKSYKRSSLTIMEIKNESQRTCIRKLTIVKVKTLGKGIYRDNLIIIKIVVAVFQKWTSQSQTS
jgi:hypothetical protein